MDMSRIPSEVQADWEGILQRDGMTVLYIWVKAQIKKAQMELDSWQTDSYDKVCRSRGHLEAMKSLASFLDKETQRAVKDHTPQKENK